MWSCGTTGGRTLVPVPWDGKPRNTRFIKFSQTPDVSTTTLPAWAQRIPVVVARCKTDLPYRCNVCSAKTRWLRRLLAKDARGE